MTDSASSSKSSDARPTRYYTLHKGCCGHRFSAALCTEHISRRLAHGWKLDTDGRADSQPCYDCQTEGQS